jgi:hypothetical protein
MSARIIGELIGAAIHLTGSLVDGVRGNGVTAVPVRAANPNFSAHEGIEFEDFEADPKLSDPENIAAFKAAEPERFARLTKEMAAREGWWAEEEEDRIAREASEARKAREAAEPLENYSTQEDEEEEENVRVILTKPDPILFECDSCGRLVNAVDTTSCPGCGNAISGKSRRVY